MRLELKTVTVKKVKSSWVVEAKKTFNSEFETFARCKRFEPIAELALDICSDEDKSRVRAWIDEVNEKEK